MSDFRSELCKKCIHTKVCMKDKNVVGDVFVAGNPMIFDNKKLWEEYKEREAQGFPCKDFMDVSNVQEVKTGRWRLYSPLTDTYECDKCGYQVIDESFRTNYCPNCGALMDKEVDNEPDP